MKEGIWAIPIPIDQEFEALENDGQQILWLCLVMELIVQLMEYLGSPVMNIFIKISTIIFVIKILLKII